MLHSLEICVQLKSSSHSGVCAHLQINDWVVNSRTAEDGQLPKFPSEAEGGSKSILEQQPAVQEAPVAEKGKRKQPGRPASGAGKGKDPLKKGAPAGAFGC